MPAASTTLRSCICPHWPRVLGLRRAVTSAPVSVRSRSPESASARSCASSRPRDSRRSWSRREQFRVDPAELLLDRPDQLLDRRPALLELAVGLGLGGLQLRPRHLGQLRHARLQRVGAQRLERLPQLALGVLHGRQALGRPLALVRQVGAGLHELTIELAGTVGLPPRARAAAAAAPPARCPAPIRMPTMRKRISMGRQALRDRRTDRKNACMSASSIRLRLRIHGRVQGVWFRDSVRRIATEHGVSGWAENLPDGSVEVVLEGRARRGPGGRGVLPGGAGARSGRPMSTSGRRPSRGSVASRSASERRGARPRAAQTSTGSSLPARRSRPRCTAAMNFDRLTSSVLRISSA